MNKENNLITITQRQFNHLLNKDKLIKVVGEFVYDAADLQYKNEEGVVLAERKVYMTRTVYRAHESIIDPNINLFSSYSSVEYSQHKEDGYPFDFLGSDF